MEDNISWQPVEWAHITNIYEVNIRQYTTEGTFNSFCNHLPRLKEMGVQVLWLMPITPISFKKRKGSMGSPYACSDYTSINPEFGNLDDFKKLVRAAQMLNMRVIIDWVANHTGWDHVWTHSHPDYFKRDESINDFKSPDGMGDIIELNYANPALREAMVDAMEFWVRETGIDGFRCDLASWVTADFWQHARTKLELLKRLFWLGEFDELENPEHGKVFDVSYSWKWMHKTQEFYQQHQPVQDLRTLLQSYAAIGDNSMRAWFTSNHDENSWNGSEYEKYGEIAKALAIFSATWNGVPLMYSGQELPNHKRLAFFDKDPIHWTDHCELQDFYKTLYQLHADNPALRGGDVNIATTWLRTNAEDKVLIYLRKKDDQAVLVLLNLSGHDIPDFEILDAGADGSYHEIFSGEMLDLTLSRKIMIDAWDCRVWQK